jgi:hypothetical protein
MYHWLRGPVMKIKVFDGFCSCSDSDATLDVGLINGKRETDGENTIIVISYYQISSLA